MTGYNDPINYNASIGYNGVSTESPSPEANRGSYPIDDRKRKKRSWEDDWQEKIKLDKSIEETLLHTYSAIHEAVEDDPELSAKIEKLVKPVSEVKRGLPEPDEINYTLLAHKTALLKQLLQIEQQLEEEAAVFLLLGN